MQKNIHLKSVKFRNFNIRKTSVNISQMFCGCTDLTTVDFGKYKEAGAFTAEGTTDYNSMFVNCSSLEVLDLSAFNNNNKSCTAKAMFGGCLKLKAIYVTDPDAPENNGYGLRMDSGVTNDGDGKTDDVFKKYKKMFEGCINLVGGSSTVYDATNNGAGYARVDKAGQKGYFTKAE